LTLHDTRENNLRRFYDAALAVFAEKGFHAARMDEIAARAGRSKGSLYHHFGSKQELLLAVVGELLTQIQGGVQEGMDQHSSASALLLYILDEFIEYFERDSRLVRVFIEFMSISARDEEVRISLARYYQQAIDGFAQIFAWGVQRGEFRSDLDIPLVARTFAFAADGAALLDHIMDPEGGSLRSTLTTLATVFLRGVAATPEA